MLSDLYRVVYKSKSSVVTPWSTVRSILDVSMRNNQRDDISGILMWMDSHCLQVLEGQRKRWRNATSEF